MTNISLDAELTLWPYLDNNKKKIIQQTLLYMGGVFLLLELMAGITNWRLLAFAFLFKKARLLDWSDSTPNGVLLLVAKATNRIKKIQLSLHSFWS